MSIKINSISTPHLSPENLNKYWEEGLLHVKTTFRLKSKIRCYEPNYIPLVSGGGPTEFFVHAGYKGYVYDTCLYLLKINLPDSQ